MSWQSVECHSASGQQSHLGKVLVDGKNQCSINFTAVEELSTRLCYGDFVQNSRPLLVILLCKNETRETKTGSKNGKNVEKTILSAVYVSAPSLRCFH